MKIHDNAITGGIGELISDIKKNYKLVIGISVAAFILSILIVGGMVQMFAKTVNPQNSVTLFGCFPAAFSSKIGTTLVFIFFFAMMFIVYKISRSFKKDYIKDAERNFNVSKTGEFGRSHFQTFEERKECCHIGTIEQLKSGAYKENVLGIDEKNRLHALKTIRSLNKNSLIVGNAGSGKSDALLLGWILQTMARGESIVVTDSKGDIFADTYYIAKNVYNYEIIRVLNLKPSELEYSDGCEFLYNMTEEDADVIATTIINNTENASGHVVNLDYFAKNELNLLKAILMMPQLNGENTKTLADVYDYLTQDGLTPQRILTDITTRTNGDPYHPARRAFSIFAQAEPKIQGQLLNGMAIRLSTLSNAKLKNIVRYNDIDLVLPMKKKCIYYVIISDTNNPYKFIASLFFSRMLTKQKDYSDSLTREEKEKQLGVWYYLDEYKSTGNIPMMGDNIANCRSRKMYFSLVLQDLGQLEDMHPGNEWTSILNNLTIKILLATDDPRTAKYFSDKLGPMTLSTKRKSYYQDSTNIIKAHPQYNEGESKQRRDSLMNSAEIMNELGLDELIILVSRHFPMKLKKFFSKDYPQMKHKKEIRPYKYLIHRKQIEFMRQREEILRTSKERAETEAKVMETQKKLLSAYLKSANEIVEAYTDCDLSELKALIEASSHKYVKKMEVEDIKKHNAQMESAIKKAKGIVEEYRKKASEGNKAAKLLNRLMKLKSDAEVMIKANPRLNLADLEAVIIDIEQCKTLDRENVIIEKLNVLSGVMAKAEEQIEAYKLNINKAENDKLTDAYETEDEARADVYESEELYMDLHENWDSLAVEDKPNTSEESNKEPVVIEEQETQESQAEKEAPVTAEEEMANCGISEETGKSDADNKDADNIKTEEEPSDENVRKKPRLILEADDTEEKMQELCEKINARIEELAQEYGYISGMNREFDKVKSCIASSKTYDTLKKGYDSFIKNSDTVINQYRDQHTIEKQKLIDNIRKSRAQLIKKCGEDSPFVLSLDKHVPGDALTMSKSYAELSKYFEIAKGAVKAAKE